MGRGCKLTADKIKLLLNIVSHVKSLQLCNISIDKTETDNSTDIGFIFFSQTMISEDVKKTMNKIYLSHRLY